MLEVKIATAVLGVVLISGCSHVSQIALLSNGDLEGKTISSELGGAVLSGEDCGHKYSLADAMDMALKHNDYDTLVDVEVESTSGILVVTNCIKVKGKGVNSKLIPKG